jgi:hypothetical protein
MLPARTPPGTASVQVELAQSRRGRRNSHRRTYSFPKVLPDGTQGSLIDALSGRPARRTAAFLTVQLRRARVTSSFGRASKCVQLLANSAASPGRTPAADPARAVIDALRVPARGRWRGVPELRGRTFESAIGGSHERTACRITAACRRALERTAALLVR